MPHFTTETVLSVAEGFLAAAGRAPNAENAANQLLQESITGRLAPLPEETEVKPAVLFDIFLSHSSLDQLQVLGIYRLLIQRGYKVYLDQVCDPYLDRTRVTPITARVIHYRMVQSKSLFVATSSNVSQSKWVPWELGFSDGWNGKAAVLPILSHNVASFNGQEYFGIYPEVHDGGAGRIKPNDLEIHEHVVLVESWGKWVSRSRTF
jgi:hypothetical protein